MQKKNIDFSYFYVNSPKKKTENIISQNNVCDDGSFVAIKKKKTEKRSKIIPSSRIRTSDLRMTSFTLQSSALPTELSKESRIQEKQ